MEATFTPVVVLSDDFSRVLTAEPDVGSPQIGKPWTLYGLNFATATRGRVSQGHVETSVNGQAGVVWLTQSLSNTPVIMKFSGRWITGAGSGAEGYFMAGCGTGNGTAGLNDAVLVEFNRTTVTLRYRTGGSWYVAAVDTYTELASATVHDFEIRFYPHASRVEAYVNDTLVLTSSESYLAPRMGKHIGFYLGYDAADTTKIVLLESVEVSTDFGYADTPVGIRRVATAPADPRQVLWDITIGAPATGWAHMMSVVDGYVYSNWTNGLLAKVDLESGNVVAYNENVAYMTPVQVVGDYVWAFKPTLISKLSKATLATVAQYTLADGIYTEEVPYDQTTGYFFVRRKVSGNHRVSAIDAADGTVAWTTTDDLGSGDTYNNYGAPLVAEDSVFVMTSDGTDTYLWRFAAADGTDEWSGGTEVGPGTRTEYNNPIYVPGTPNGSIFGVTNDGTAFCVNATTGALVWSVDLSGGGYTNWSTPTYHNGHVYIGMNGGAWTGRVFKLNATTGAQVWMQPGYVRPGQERGEDCWNPGITDGQFLYRNVHARGSGIVIQNCADGGYVWQYTTDDAPCTYCCLSGGILVAGNNGHLIGVRVGHGPRTITRARSSNVATFKTSVAHGLAVDQAVTIRGAGGAGYNVSSTVVSTPTTTSFTIASTGDDESETAEYGGRVLVDYPWHGTDRTGYVAGAVVEW